MDSRLKKALVQERVLRKWRRFKILLCPHNEEQLASIPERQISPEILVTVEELEAFMWWLYLPKNELTDGPVRASDNCDYSFTYVEHLTNHLLTFIEEKGWKDAEMGLKVFRGDVEALRTRATDVVKKISL